MLPKYKGVKLRPPLLINIVPSWISFTFLGYKFNVHCIKVHYILDKVLLMKFLTHASELTKYMNLTSTVILGSASLEALS